MTPLYAYKGNGPDGRKALAGAIAVLAFASAAHAGPMYVYRGGGCAGFANLPAWESFISTNRPGTKADGVVDFVAFDSWSSFDSDAGYDLGCWKGKGYPLALSVPLTVNGTSLADVAAGKEDAHFTKLGQEIAANGFNVPTTFIRIGWEFNGGWYPWHAYGYHDQFVAAFRRVVPLIRAGAPNVKIVWNTAEGTQQVSSRPLDDYYPGDDVVDVVATDAYANSWVPGAFLTPAKPANNAAEPAMWNNLNTQTWGYAKVIAFAKQHGKPYAFPEWATGNRGDGHGGGDDPVFIQNMAPLVAGAAFSAYWDFPASDYNGRLHDLGYPKTAAAFLAAFYPAPVATTAPKPTVATVKLLTATIWPHGSVDVVNNPDGSATLTVTFPQTATKVTYTINISAKRKVGTWGEMTAIGWGSTGGTATIHVGAT